MPRKSDAATLASFWSAPESIPGLEDEPGKPLACVSTTYEFDAGEFERELLSRFLGCRLDDDVNGSLLAVVERERRLAEVDVAVLVDLAKVDPAQSTLRWDQIPICMPRGIQHAKVTVLHWERLVRIVIGSANLTRAGYRTNREMAAVFDFFDGEASTPQQFGLDVIDFLTALLKFALLPDGTRVRTRSTLRDVRGFIQRASSAPEDFGRGFPRAVFAPTMPDASPLDVVKDIWGSRRVRSMSVVSPFVAGTEGAQQEVVAAVRACVGWTRDATAEIGVVLRPLPGSAAMQAQLPAATVVAWCRVWQCEADDIGLREIEPEELVRERRPVTRALHAKVIAMSDDERTMLLCGSSNFTPRGLGIYVSKEGSRIANAEANVVFWDERNTRRNGLRLEDRVPGALDGKTCNDVRWLPDASDATTEPEPALRRPPFEYIVYREKSRELVLRLGDSQIAPPQWRIRYPSVAEAAPAIWTEADAARAGPDRMLRASVPEEVRATHLTHVLLEWSDGGPWSPPMPIPLHVEDRADLLPPRQATSYSADLIIDSLMRGRDPEDLEIVSEQNDGPTARDFGQDALRAVDTRDFDLYRVRRLSRAFHALGENLVATRPTRDALTFRLRSDPFGAASLSKAIEHDWSSGAATLSETQRFALAEIALVLAESGHRLVKSSRKQRTLVAEVVREVIEELLTMAARDGLRGDPILGYVQRVRRRADERLPVRQGDSNAG